MPGLSQKERVRRALVKAGPRGVTASDFAAPHPIDNGKPIMRVAARIHELNDEGWPSVQLGERDSCGIYVLKKYLSVPDVEVGAVADPPMASHAPVDPHTHAAASTSAPADLFSNAQVEGSSKPQCAIDDDWEAAA